MSRTPQMIALDTLRLFESVIFFFHPNEKDGVSQHCETPRRGEDSEKEKESLTQERGAPVLEEKMLSYRDREKSDIESC